MTHVTLHLAKYLGPLSGDASTSAYRKAFIDSFIMIASASNTLTIRMSEHACNATSYQRDNCEYLPRYIATLSSLAKACDASDHIEDYQVNRTWHSASIEFLRLTLQQASAFGINILEAADRRLNQVEREHGLHFIHQDGA